MNTDEHRWLRPRPGALSVFICVHLWIFLSGSAAAQETAAAGEAGVPEAVVDAAGSDAGPETADGGGAEESATEPYVLDEQSGYYWTFSFVATLGEIFGGVMLGAGITGLVDAYDRRSVAAHAETPEDGDGIRGTADGLELTGWLISSFGVLTFGLGLPLDLVLGSEFGDDDWWVRACITTPLAAAAGALISAGVVQVYRANDYRALALQMGTAAEREARRADATDFEIMGWSFIGAGAATAVAVTAYWVWDWIDADVVEGDGEEEGSSDVAVALVPAVGPGMQGLGLIMSW
ncbi:MAG: hypothetical protein HY907_05380 [Deltaproteobacteria bacterium]|nr:hypothetical protein [Deltaproteobacteria bacterium]